MELQRFKRRVRAIRDTSSTLRALPLSQVYEQAARQGGFESWNALAATFETLEESRAEAILDALEKTGDAPFTGLKRQPIEKLPELLRQIEEQVEIYRSQQRLLEQAEKKPHVMDDATLDRVIRLMEDQRPVREAIAEQIRIWQADKSVDDQKTLRQLSAAGKGNSFLRETAQQLLTTARAMKSLTIDRIMEKSDVELGLSFLLSGELKFPSTDAPAKAEGASTRHGPHESEEKFVRRADQTARFLEQEKIDESEFMDRMACHIPAMADLLESRHLEEIASQWAQRYAAFGRFCEFLQREHTRTGRPLPIFGMIYQKHMPTDVKQRYAEHFERSGDYELDLFSGKVDESCAKALKKEGRALTTLFRKAPIDGTTSRLLRVSLEYLDENREAAGEHRESMAYENFVGAVRDVKAELDKIVDTGTVADRDALKAAIKRAIDADPKKP